MGELRPPLAAELQPSGWDASVRPPAHGEPCTEGFVLHRWEERSLQAFPWLLVIGQLWGEILPFQMFSLAARTPMRYL